MTLQELIVEYRGRILTSKDKRAATAEIIKEIDKLTYSSNSQPISVEDKIKILDGLRKQIITESLEHFAQDNKEYLELINQALKALGGKQ